MRNVSHKAVEKSKHTFYVQFFFFWKSCRLWDNLETFFTDGGVTDDNKCACAFHTEYLRLQTHTLGICKNNCFPSATMFAGTHLNITLYAHFLCFLLSNPFVFVSILCYISLNRTIEQCILSSRWQDVRYFTWMWYNFAKTCSQHKVKICLTFCWPCISVHLSQ